MIQRFLKNYLPRHRNRWNQRLHSLGVPVTFVVPVVLAVRGVEGYGQVGCFFFGYLLQFAGHVFERNDAGEVIFLKKLLGMPYTEYGPESECSSNSDCRDDSTSN